jgi:hypothetical protein
MSDPSAPRSRRGRPTLGGLAAGLFAASLLFGLLTPIYTDEVGWRFQARMAFDGVDRFIAEGCGPNTLAVPPLFMLPLRYASATANQWLADPIFIRLAGVFWALVWAAMVWRLTRRIGRDARERDVLRILGFGLLGFGVLPLLLVMSRPEQPLLLTLTAALLVAAGRWDAAARPADRAGRAALKAAIVVFAGALALGYHLKGVVYMPVFLACAALSSVGAAGRGARIAALAALIALSALAAPYWVTRFQCPADPVLAAALARENVASLVFDKGVSPETLGAILPGADPRGYIALALPAPAYMSDWLPRLDFKGKPVRTWRRLIRDSWCAALLLAAGCVTAAIVAAVRRRRVEPRVVLPVMLAGVAACWGVSQLNKNVYEAALALPAAMLFILLSIRSAALSPGQLKAARALACVILALSAGSQVILVAAYARPLWSAVHTPGYVAGQPFSVSPYGYGGIKADIVAAGRRCGIDPGGRPQALLVDDLTYFPYMTSWRPLHRLGVLSAWNGRIGDPIAYLKVHNSSGVVMGCALLPPGLRSRARAVGQFCCLGPPDWGGPGR